MFLFVDEADDTAKVARALPAPRFTVDNTGWVSLQATAEWWRSQIDSDDWPDIAEQMAQEGEAAIQPGRCRAIGVTTGRPCRVDTRFEPCPHHGPGNETNRCGARTTGNTLCRWNLAVRGPCRSHPHTYERIIEEERAHRADLRRQQEAEQAEWEKRFAERTRAAEQLPCSYCAAGPGQACTQQSTGMPAGKVHSPRYKLLDHTLLTAIPCQSCGALAGDLCQTSTGKQSTEAHAPRRRSD